MDELLNKRVRMRRDIEQPASGDHPTMLLASRGETGVVERVRPSAEFPLWIRMDRDAGGRPGTPYNRDRIGVKVDEVEVLP